MKSRTLLILLALCMFNTSCDSQPTYVPPPDDSQEQAYLPPPDSDEDKIPDWVEDWVASNFAPYMIHDEQELSENVRYIYQVTPVKLNGQSRVLLIIVALYNIDWAEVSEAADYDVQWHYGDTESVRIYLSWVQSFPNNSDRRFEGDYKVDQVAIHRHSDVHDYPANKFEFVQSTHIVLWVSEGKHAMYSSKSDCEGSSFFKGFDEDCGSGPEWYADLPPSLNVGERKHPYFLIAEERQELLVFSGEMIWENDYPFCGGYIVGDARWDYWDIPVFGKWPECAGSIGGKWFPWP